MKVICTMITVAMAAAALTGCSGIEIGGKAWIMKVDEAESAQKTHASKPLKCLFVDCAEKATEAQGS